jgi:hypothetical protein
MSSLSPLESNKNAVFVPAQHVAIEYFETGALILNLRSRTLIELDSREGWILRNLDGQRTVDQVAIGLAETFKIPYNVAMQAALATCDKLGESRCLRLVQGAWRGDTVDDTRYLQNPDVNLREEDEDGALLYNPDADRVQLLNTTGLYIWKFCAQGHTTGEIISALKADFDDVPEDALAADVEEFVNEMIDTGFLGTLQTG